MRRSISRTQYPAATKSSSAHKVRPHPLSQTARRHTHGANPHLTNGSSHPSHLQTQRLAAASVGSKGMARGRGLLLGGTNARHTAQSAHHAAGRTITPSTVGKVLSRSAIQETILTMQEDSLPHQTWDSKEGTWVECRSPPQPNINVTVSTHAADFEAHGHTLRRERHNLSTTALADTGCQSCLAGPLLLSNLNLRRSDLIPACLAMKFASGNSLPIMGAALLRVKFRQRDTRQMVYFSPLASKLYLSLSTCQDLGLVSSAFPLSTAAASSKETPLEHSTQTRSNRPSAPRPAPKSTSNPAPALQIKPQTPPAARLPKDTRQRPCSCPTRTPGSDHAPARPGHPAATMLLPDQDTRQRPCSCPTRTPGSDHAPARPGHPAATMLLPDQDTRQRPCSCSTRTPGSDHAPARPGHPAATMLLPDQDTRQRPCSCPTRAPPPDKPTTLPFPGTIDNRHKLERHLLDLYSASAFNVSEHQPLPLMSGPPLSLSIDPTATFKSFHTPIPVPVHWQDEVKAGLDRDVCLGVLEKVPLGMPVTWCRRMVICTKKNGSLRRTINFQPLNRHATRETHHCQSPFHQARAVPRQTKKTVFDAWNGYHSVALAEEDRHLTTFITPWGRYRYCTAPQGYIASGDAYTARYNALVAGVMSKTKCIDDALFWSSDITEAFHQAVEWLHICAVNGITLNPKKFHFAGGLSRNAVNCPSHPTVPWDHGITWDCPSYPTAPWDFPRDVHLSLYRCMCPTVHPIPRSHGIVGYSTGCPPVPLQMHVSYCPSHPTVPWDRGTFHGMSTCPSH